jgi:hypothetical protein
MLVKRKEYSGHTYFFLCIAECGGNNGNSGKVMEYSVCLGETLNLSSARWSEILRAAREFRSVPLEDILKVVENYVAKHGFPSETVVGLREAVHGAAWQKSGRRISNGRRTATDEYATALRLLGVPLGSSENEIESAFRKSTRLHHPDVGGDSAKFRAILAARNLLLGRHTRTDKIA